MLIKPRFLLRNLESGFRRHGPAFPLILVSRLAEFAYVRLAGEKMFTFQGRNYSHFYHLENPTFRSERSVEVGLGMSILSEFDQEDVLEVGNVLANYGSFTHTVVDKYETDKGVINEDIVSYNPGRQFKLVISISTLEHVGWDEEPREPSKLLSALEAMRSLLSPGGVLFITVPLGYNSFLDERIAVDRLGLDGTGFLFRDPSRKKWREAEFAAVQGAKYGSPFPNANAIMISRSKMPDGL